MKVRDLKAERERDHQLCVSSTAQVHCGKKRGNKTKGKKSEGSKKVKNESGNDGRAKKSLFKRSIKIPSKI